MKYIVSLGASLGIGLAIGLRLGARFNEEVYRLLRRRPPRRVITTPVEVAANGEAKTRVLVA